MNRREKEKIRTTLNNLDIPELTYKMNRVYMEQNSQRWIKLFPDSYPEMGIGAKHVWEEMTKKVIKEIKKALHISQKRRKQRRT